MSTHTHTHTHTEHAKTWRGIAVGFDDEAHESKTVARCDVDKLKLSQQHVISLSYKKKIKRKKYKYSFESSSRAAIRGLDPKPETKPQTLNPDSS